MKRRVHIIALLLSIFPLLSKAQTNLETAIDFTATDINGQQIKLFDILDSGKYVLIDFFGVNYGLCYQTTPNVNEAYKRFGYNQHDVFFMEISPDDDNLSLQTWANNFKIDYPTIGKDGGGNTIYSQYVINYIPTVILIAPDRNIVLHNIYPSSADILVNTLLKYGIHEQEYEPSEPYCTPASNLKAEINGSNVQLTWSAPELRSSEVLLSTDFENDVPQGWKQIDADGDGYVWRVIGEQPTVTVIGNGGTGKCVTSISYYYGMGLNPDNYLITPRLAGASSINYWVSVQDTYYYNEHYAVMVSKSGINASDFTILFEETMTGKKDNSKEDMFEKNHKAQGKWKERTIELPEGTKYVAFRHYNSLDTYYLNIDDITVFGGAPVVNDYTYNITKNGIKIASGLAETSYTDNNVADGNYDYCVEVVYENCTSDPSCAEHIIINSIDNEVENSTFKVYPNPAKDIINVNGDVTNVVMYNSIGQAVRTKINNGKVDVSSLENGIYYLVIKSSDRTQRVEKVIIAK